MAAKLLNSVLITTKIDFSIINAITMHILFDGILVPDKPDICFMMLA